MDHPSHTAHDFASLHQAIKDGVFISFVTVTKLFSLVRAYTDYLLIIEYRSTLILFYHYLLIIEYRSSHSKNQLLSEFWKSNMFVVTYILGMESEVATSSIWLEDGYSEYATHQRKRKKRSKVWKELEQGKNAQGEKTATCKHCKVVMTANPNSGCLLYTSDAADE